MHKEINFIITTGETISSTSKWQDESFFTVSVTSLSTTSLLGVGVKILPSSYSNSFSNFDELEMQIISDSALFRFSNTYYGVNLNKAPEDILQSKTMTLVEKNALVLALSFYNAGYYVIADVKKKQKTYKEFLNKYNIPTRTFDS